MVFWKAAQVQSNQEPHSTQVVGPRLHTVCAGYMLWGWKGIPNMQTAQVSSLTPCR